MLLGDAVAVAQPVARRGGLDDHALAAVVEEVGSVMRREEVAQQIPGLVGADHLVAQRVPGREREVVHDSPPRRVFKRQALVEAAAVAGRGLRAVAAAVDVEV